MSDYNAQQAAAMRGRAAHLLARAALIDPTPQIGEARSITVIFPGGAVLTVMGAGVEGFHLADTAADLARSLLAQPAPALAMSIPLAESAFAPASGSAVGDGDLQVDIHDVQPDADAGGGK